MGQTVLIFMDFGSGLIFNAFWMDQKASQIRNKSDIWAPRGGGPAIGGKGFPDVPQTPGGSYIGDIGAGPARPFGPFLYPIAF